ncbi:MAG: hypothetical protein HXX11_16760 [Desulfuromonadales bacterium]|nr:hypothetical protein [Desulfuromonadales bacterium]
MADQVRTLQGRGIARKMLLRCVLVMVSGAVAGAFFLLIVLNSSAAPKLVSRLLGDYLQNGVRITAVQTEGGALTLTGLELLNPPDASPGTLCRVDSLTITPNWSDLLMGKRSLRLLSLGGIRIDLHKNSTGVWNFSHLQRVLTAKKPSGKELLISRFIVKGGSLLVNGQGPQGLSLQLDNLTTKGSRTARMELTFEDGVQNRYTLGGQTRTGKEPALDLTLSAPSLSLDRLAGMLKLKNSPRFGSSCASLSMTAALHGGHLQVKGGLGFSHVPLMLGAQKNRPLAGRLEFAAGYDSGADRARLESLTLTLNDLAAIHAAAVVDRLRTERTFRVDLDVKQVDLAALLFLLPAAEQGKTALGGTLGSGGIHLAGDSGGLTGADGTVLLQNAWLKRDGRPLFTGVDSTLSLSRVASGFQMRGKLSRRPSTDNSLLETLDATLLATLSNQLKLVKLQVPALTATAMGIAIAGRLEFKPKTSRPFSAALRMSADSVAKLRSLTEMHDLKLEGGPCTVSVEAVGRGPRDFNASAVVRLASLQGMRGQRRFGMKNGLMDARISRSSGVFSATGATRLSGLNLDGRAGDARFSYRFADDTVLLSDGSLLFDGASVSFARLVARLPAKVSIDGPVRYPLSAHISGAVIQRGDAVVNGLSATLRGNLFSDSRDRWLEGIADLSTDKVAWQGKVVGSPRVHIAVSRSGGRGDLGGTLLGGTLNGAISFKPFAPREAGMFQVGIKGGRIAQMGELLHRRGTASLSDGVLDGTCKGSYSAADGFNGRFEAAGTGISAIGSGSKTLFSGAGLKLDGTLSRKKLVLEKLLFIIGTGVGFTIRGEMANPLVAQREGRFTFMLPETSLNGVIDPFVNMLPRMIQEANVEGSLASEGTLVLRNGRQLLEGVLRFKSILLDVPSQKLKVAEINGRFPFSLDLSGTASAQIRETASFTRENYPQLLGRFRKASGAGQVISIAGVTFGTLNLGEVKLVVNAEDGITKISSLRSSLYEGTLLGTGYIAFNQGLSYRADLLINGLSLNLFCASIPKIKDYISGRVDGVVSLDGAGKGMSGLTGFTELWAREGGGEKMLVSKVFLQKLSGKNLSGFFFRNDRPFDQAEISADLEDGFLTFETLDISHTNLFGVRDLSVAIAPSQNRIALDHLLDSIKQATTRGKAATGEKVTDEPAAEPEFKWQE